MIFPFLCSSASCEPHAKILYKFPVEAKMHSAWASSRIKGSWMERNGSLQRELCLGGGNGTQRHSLYRSSSFLGYVDTGVFHTNHLVWHVKPYKCHPCILKTEGVEERTQLIIACLQAQGPEFDPRDWCEQELGVVMYT